MAKNMARGSLAGSSRPLETARHLGATLTPRSDSDTLGVTPRRSKRRGSAPAGSACRNAACPRRPPRGPSRARCRCAVASSSSRSSRRALSKAFSTQSGMMVPQRLAKLRAPFQFSIGRMPGSQLCCRRSRPSRRHRGSGRRSRPRRRTGSAPHPRRHPACASAIPHRRPDRRRPGGGPGRRRP